MNQNTANNSTVAFKPWPTIGYGVAVYIGSTVIGVWLLALLSMAFMNEAIDISPVVEGNITPELAYYFLQLVCISAVVGSAIIYYLTRTRLKAGTDAYLGVTPVSWKQMQPWLWLAFGYVFISGIVTTVYDSMSDPTPVLDPLAMLDPSLMLLVTIIIAVPMWEELLFRGFIFEGLKNSPLGVNGAILLSSVWWAGMHTNYNLGGLIVILIFGILLGLARARFNSVLLPIAMHSIYNGVILVLSKVAS
ncbi:MAG: CPBP family intramembrane metalloprotease [Alphaproteobacteria bacterium]|nr:MAG: CPBP family intramembrane metalloprotease [Alphaproteobacteria bacterium]